ncbi:MAG: DEAD/DEAH box helicase [Alphaproteobacteria bacterium]
MQNFDSLGLRPALLRALAQMNFTTPTPIQAAAIPPALEGKDILGTAQTGTGKTGAFGIPLVSRLLANPQDGALVMTPTRELAVQVMAMLQQLLGTNSGITTALLIGGEAMGKQLRQLQSRPRLIVGTPGRINDHLARRTVRLERTSFLVLDETDRMLDMGFGVQIDKIIAHLPKPRQTLLFSATLPANILKLSGKYLSDPVRVSVGSTTAPIVRIKQETIQLAEADKYGQLLVQLQQREGSIIVFVKTKWGADKMAKKLRAMNHRADAIHGNLRQRERDRAIAAFRSKETRIMVATDIAARGLDIPHIEHVINYDLPQCPEDYIHRIGRTARAGAEGEAINLVTPADGKKWSAIRRLLNPEEKREHTPRAAQGPRGNGQQRRRYRPNRHRGSDRQAMRPAA